MSTMEMQPFLKGEKPLSYSKAGLIGPGESAKDEPEENIDADSHTRLHETPTIEQHIDILGVYVPMKALNVCLAIFSVLFNVAMNISLPLYSQAVNRAKGDEYNVLLFSTFWFPIIFYIMVAFIKIFIDRDMPILPTSKWYHVVMVGSLNALSGLMMVYASDPSRTPPYLQAVLATSIIPYTVIARLVIRRIGVCFKRFVCTGVVLVGLFLCSVPQIFGINKPARNNEEPGTPVPMASKVFWPVIFALGFLPVGILNVIIEIAMKKDEAESVTFIAASQGISFLTIVFFFWTDFIPGFGQANSTAEFVDHLHTSLLCHFGADQSCLDVLGLSWLFIFSYVLSCIFMFLLIRYAEGAIYAVIVIALVTPLGTLWWTLFQSSPQFAWGPVFNETTVFTLIGLSIMMPGVIMYNYFSQKDVKEKEQLNQSTRLQQP
ncbi:unnamed protein product [Owenia fusiformis]|uniref:Uncharacterized protein n=1 Tax=Owenia fusiformis TaxID=6347 RepID=A0A8J1U9D7_OWEFU|nr:unnamed protein product [Owenia fusiformis]